MSWSLVHCKVNPSSSNSAKAPAVEVLKVTQYIHMGPFLNLQPRVLWRNLMGMVLPYSVLKRSLLFLCFIILGSCHENNLKEKYTTLFAGNAMTIDYRVIIGKKLTSQEAESVKEAISEIFESINTTFNNWNPNSELSKLNQLKSNVTVPISLELNAVLKQTDDIVNLTNGLFDPTMEPLHKLWKEHLEKGEIPTTAQIKNISLAIGWNKIHLIGQNFYKSDDRTAIDLGGIVKGHCVDLLIEKLNELGFPDVLVEWGGEIRTTGAHPEGRPWTVFVSGLGSLNPDKAIAKIEMNDLALATSGDYLQNWTVIENEHEITYFHIINPLLKRPLRTTEDSIASASVATTTCALADAIATTLMLFPTLNEAKQWVKGIQPGAPLRCWIATRKKSEYVETSSQAIEHK
ncbi:MAG: FAD:protein FMN transferase [Parachlamydiaceae bacterium]|nr:FAD:protein FMN transferase [Parachlamydiaceae bacterium]